jgi:exodeoxyribonuclease VII large subunit
VARHAGLGSADRAEARLHRRTERVGRAAVLALDRPERVLAQLGRRTAGAAAGVLGRAETALAGHGQTTAQRARRELVAAGRSVDGLDARVRAHDPAHALARGWSISSSGGRLVRSAADVRPGDPLTTRLAAGTVESTVTATHAPANDVEETRP